MTQLTEQLIEKYPHLLTNKTDFAIYKRGDLLSIEDKIKLIDTLCVKISDLFVNKQMEIDFIRYKFSSLQITFAQNLSEDEHKLLQENTDCVYVLKHN